MEEKERQLETLRTKIFDLEQEKKTPETIRILHSLRLRKKKLIASMEALKNEVQSADRARNRDR